MIFPANYKSACPCGSKPMIPPFILEFPIFIRDFPSPSKHHHFTEIYQNSTFLSCKPPIYSVLFLGFPMFFPCVHVFSTVFHHFPHLFHTSSHPPPKPLLQHAVARAVGHLHRHRGLHCVARELEGRVHRLLDVLGAPLRRGNHGSSGRGRGWWGMKSAGK